MENDFGHIPFTHLPGLIQVWRFRDKNNDMLADWIEIEWKTLLFQK